MSEYEKGTDQWYLSQYLKYGSVEQVYKVHRWDIDLPLASYHRLVRRSGIIKNSGRREVSLSELLYFFMQKALQPTVGIETLYYKKMPPSFQTSLATLHRTYNNILNHEPARCAAALIVKSEHKSGILIGQEVTSSRRYGKMKGDYSIPMGFSQQNEPPASAVLRVLQQEVLTKKAILGELSLDSKLALQLIPINIEPVFYYDILDVRVGVYELMLPTMLKRQLGSYKLEELTFEPIQKIINPSQRHYRAGVSELVSHYVNKSGYLSQSFINKALAVASN